jgi:hypothetical protein
LSLRKPTTFCAAAVFAIAVAVAGIAVTATHCCLEPEESCQNDFMVWHDLLHCYQQRRQNAMEATKFSIPAAAVLHTVCSRSSKCTYGVVSASASIAKHHDSSANTAIENQIHLIRPAAVHQ